MSILRELVPYLKYYKGILIHFGSCIENLTEIDEGNFCSWLNVSYRIVIITRSKKYQTSAKN